METAIEVELRAFITDAVYTALRARFAAEGTLLDEDTQETTYFDAPIDVRAQQGTKSGKIWMKGGKMHESAREEIEVPLAPEHVPAMVKVFAKLGFGEKVAWHRHRLTFAWRGVTVMLDDTRGYGKILEMERVTTAAHVEEARTQLRSLFVELGVPVTAREEFDRRYTNYLASWKSAARK